MTGTLALRVISLVLAGAFSAGIADVGRCQSLPGSTPAGAADDWDVPQRLPLVRAVVERPRVPPVEAAVAPPEEVETEILAEDATLVDAELVVPSPWQCWSGSVEFGLSGTDGNSQTFNMRFGAKAKHETDAVIHKYELTHLKQQSEGRKTAHRLLLDERVEWLSADTPCTVFVHAAGEYDEFKPFDFRVSGDAGLGYRFIDRDCTKLTARPGGSCSREVNGPDDDYIPEMTANAEFSHQLSDRQKVSAEAEYFPNLTDWNDYRLNGKASWELVVDPDWGLSLKLSLADRFDSTPNGAKFNDLDYAALLLWSF